MGIGRLALAGWAVVIAVVMLVACGANGSSVLNRDSAEDPGIEAVDDGIDRDATASLDPDGRAMVSGVRGTVTDTGGNPIAGVMVHPTSLHDPQLLIPEMAILSDDDGTYAWDLAPGPYKLTASHAGFQSVTLRIDVAEAEVSVQDFALERLD